MFILIVTGGYWDDWDIHACYGPFDNEEAAQTFATMNKQKISADVGQAEWGFEVMSLRGISGISQEN